MKSDDSRTQCHCERFDEYTEAFTVFFLCALALRSK